MNEESRKCRKCRESESTGVLLRNNNSFLLPDAAATPDRGGGFLRIITGGVATLNRPATSCNAFGISGTRPRTHPPADAAARGHRRPRTPPPADTAARRHRRPRRHPPARQSLAPSGVDPPANTPAWEAEIEAPASMQLALRDGSRGRAAHSMYSVLFAHGSFSFV